MVRASARAVGARQAEHEEALDGAGLRRGLGGQPEKAVAEVADGGPAKVAEDLGGGAAVVGGRDDVGHPRAPRVGPRERARRAVEGAAAGDPDAIVDVVMDASRHIVSTTVTTFGGFLPLILEGSEFWPPFAMAIAGGVLLSTIVSFYLVPPLFTLLMHPGRHFLKPKPQVGPEPPIALREAA